MILTLACTNTELLPLISIAKAGLIIIQIAIPIGLIIYGTIDLGKAVISSKEEDIKKAQQLLIKRCISAILVFLIAAIVAFVTGFVGNKEWKACWNDTTSTQACKFGINSITGECKTEAEAAADKAN